MSDFWDRFASNRSYARTVLRGFRREPLTVGYCLAHRLLAPNTVRHRLQITSTGGMGTTFLYEFAQRAKLDIYKPYDGGECWFDYGMWKHLREPVGQGATSHLKVRRGFRVVYLVGNPFESVMSLFRRGFNYWTPDRLGVPPDVIERFNRRWTLEEYLAQGEDFFLLEQHVRNWTTPDPARGYPILVMKYEALGAHRDVLMDFMQVPSTKRGQFPEVTPRISSISSLPAATVENMQAMYGSLLDHINGLPDWYEH